MRILNFGGLDNRIQHEALSGLLVPKTVQSGEEKIIILEPEEPGVDVDINCKEVDSGLRVNLFFLIGNGSKLVEQLLVEGPVVDKPFV
jgi:hypothetical protein